MRELTRLEIAAMWLWGAEYAKGGLGAIEFYERLTTSRRDTVKRFLEQLDAAPSFQGPALTEDYWCGCKRTATWKRCVFHVGLDHDEEPPTRTEQRKQKARAKVRRLRSKGGKR